MQEFLTQLLLPSAAAAANVLLLLWTEGQRRPVLHAASKCVGFAVLTAALLGCGIVSGGVKAPLDGGARLSKSVNNRERLWPAVVG
jgi:hypothetical protein